MRKSMEAGYGHFVCSFCRLMEGDKTNKRQNEISFLRFGDLYNATKRNGHKTSFCRVVQVAKTKKWISFLAFLRFVEVGQNEQTTKRHKLSRNIKVWFFVVTCVVLSFVSFCRFPPRRQNNRTTTRQKWGFAAISSFCRLVQRDKTNRVIQVAKTKKWNFILAFVRFVAFHKPYPASIQILLTFMKYLDSREIFIEKKILGGKSTSEWIRE